jgi:transposase-like protein
MSGERHPLFGTKVSSETKAKMSNTRKGMLVKPEITNASIVRLYSSGLGHRAVAKILGVTRQMVQKRLKSQGVKSHPSGRRLHGLRRDR